MMASFNTKYSGMINNMAVATEFNSDFRAQLDYKMYRIVAGAVTFEEVKPYGCLLYTSRDHLAMGEEFRGMLGYLPQDFGYFPGFTAREFMEYTGALKGLLPGYARKRSRELLDVVGLADAAGQRIKTRCV